LSLWRYEQEFEGVFLIYFLARAAAESQEVGNITPAGSTDYQRAGAYVLLKKRFRVALGCKTFRRKSKLMLCWVQFISRTKETAAKALYVGNSRGFYSKCRKQ